MLFRSKPKFASSAEFPLFIDAIAQELRQSAFTSDADRLHELTHKMAWTTGTELLGELRIALKEIRKGRTGLPSELSSDIRYAIKSIDKAMRRW